MRIQRALALVLLCAVATSGAQRPGDSSFRALDAYLRSELRRLRIPGAVIAVVRGDSLVYSATFGRSDESGRAISLETPFVIGSLSKSVTALGVMMLVNDGRVALDSPVTAYLPWFHPTGESGSNRITIRHLLNQNSGIPSYAGRMDWAHPDAGDAALERHARRLATVKLAHTPGTTFEYANANYVLLGEVIQEVIHSSYEDFVEKRVFAPLGMKRSFTSPAAAGQNAMALGYRLWFGRPVAAAKTDFIRSNLPAGELIASAADMARYLSVHLSGGRYPGGLLVSSAALEELHRPVSPLNAHWSYAMGWMSGTLGGQTVLWHNGLVPDFYAFMALVPERREGLVLLVNAGNLLELPRLNRMAFGALARLIGREVDLDPSICAMCPVFPLGQESTVQAVRPIAVALVVLQCCWIAWSAKRRRWRSSKANTLSLAMALLWAASVLFAFPLVAQMPPSVMNDLMPDLADVINASVAIALAWAVVRVVVRSDRFGRQ
jgi:CubicO group peptidase (beta-lactamase class C family)